MPRNLHPLTLVLCFLFPALTVMSCTSPLVACIALCGGAAVFFYRTGWRVFAADLRFTLPFFVLVALVNPLFSHNGATVLFRLGGNAVTLESAAYGFTLSAMLTGALYWFRAMSRTVTLDQVLYLIASPAPHIALVVSAAIRFLPMMRRNLHTLSRTQMLLGTRGKGWFLRMRAAVEQFSVLITISFEDAVQAAASMKARGYGMQKRGRYEQRGFTLRDLPYLLTCVLPGLAAFVLGLFGCGAATFYPVMVLPKPDAGSVALYILYGCACFAPFLFCGWEGIRWKRLRSNI